MVVLFCDDTTEPKGNISWVSLFLQLAGVANIREAQVVYTIYVKKMVKYSCDS